jgi:hypothetical protein
MTRKSIEVLSKQSMLFVLLVGRSFSSSSHPKKDPKIPKDKSSSHSKKEPKIPKDKERLLQLVDDWEMRSTDGDDYTKIKMNKRLRRLGKKIVKQWRLRDYDEGHRTILSRQFNDWQVWLSFQYADPLPDTVDDTEDMLRHCEQDFNDMLFLANLDDFPHALELPMDKARPCDCLVSLTPSLMTAYPPPPPPPPTTTNTASTVSDFDTDKEDEDATSTTTSNTKSNTESLVLRCNFRWDKFYIHKAAILLDSPDVIHRHPPAHVVHPRAFVPMPREGDLWRELNRFMEGTFRINEMMNHFMAEYGDYKIQKEMPAFFKAVREILE